MDETVPNERWRKKVRYVEADVGYSGMRLATNTDSPKYVPSEDYKELLKELDQCRKERDALRKTILDIAEGD